MTPPPRKQARGETPCRAPPNSTGRVVRPAAPMRPNEDPAGTEEGDSPYYVFVRLNLINFRFARP